MNGRNDHLTLHRYTGIQISHGNLSADVVAAGHNAQATKSVQSGIDAQDVLALLSGLRTAVAESIADPQLREILNKEVDAITEEAAKSEPDRDRFEHVLSAFSDKLKLLGGAVTNSASLIAAAKKVAQAVGVTTALF